jgi:membrane protein implicated in regulation of membrane protease activity
METLFDSPWIWIIAGALIAGLEIVVPGVFLLWIGLGALAVGLLLALAPDLPLAWQMLLFAVAMLTSISLGFFVQRRSKTEGAPMLNQDLQAMIGRRYVALADFEAGRGRIRVADTSFAVVSDDPVKEGEIVEVNAIDGARPRVTRVVN